MKEYIQISSSKIKFLNTLRAHTRRFTSHEILTLFSVYFPSLPFRYRFSVHCKLAHCLPTKETKQKFQLPFRDETKARLTKADPPIRVYAPRTRFLRAFPVPIALIITCRTCSSGACATNDVYAPADPPARPDSMLLSSCPGSPSVLIEVNARRRRRRRRRPSWCRDRARRGWKCIRHCRGTRGGDGESRRQLPQGRETSKTREREREGKRENERERGRERETGT